MRRKWFRKGLKLAVIAVLAATVLGFVTMGLWNSIVPEVFGARAITFWQALGLLILGRLLMGGLRGRGGHPFYWRHRFEERLEQMTPEEREKFRAGMMHRCGGSGMATPGPTAASGVNQ
jgi:chromate transport protein ChrA